MAMRDVEIAISTSNIEGRAEICHHLNDFLELGQTAITKFLQHQADVNRVADASLGINRWAERSLEIIAKTDESPVGRSVSVLMSYLPGTRLTRKSVQLVYKYYTRELSEELTNVIKNGQEVIGYMMALENKLFTVAKLLAHQQQTGSERAADLDDFWRKVFGAHKHALRSVRAQIALASRLQSDVRTAMNSVQQANLRFMEINAEVESLKKALADPFIRWNNDDVRIEGYLSGIRGVIGRLENAQRREIGG